MAEAPAQAGATARADAGMLERAVELARREMGDAQPHPNAGVVLVRADGAVAAEAHLRANGAPSPEVTAVRAAGGRETLEGGTAYLNLEPGQCHGDDAPVQALIESGVSRVVVGLEHPLQHFRGEAIKALRRAGLDVVAASQIESALASSGDARGDANADAVRAVLDACRAVNAPLICRAETGRPLGVLKYAMTLDGKIAAASGHAAWVSCEASRARVFQLRAESDAVVVGGNTVRRDNPNLTTRREGGHRPLRVVLSRSMDLPVHDPELNLWNTAAAPTLVITQRGSADAATLDTLRGYGVEVIELDFLSPDAASEYLARRGFLQVLWECGGALSAPAIAEQVVHKVVAFIAPKIIGGPIESTPKSPTAPTPVGDLGNVAMTQALALRSARFEPSGTDMCVTGYLNHAFDGADYHSDSRSAVAATSVSLAPDADVCVPPDIPRSMVENMGLLPGTQFGDAAALTALCEAPGSADADEGEGSAANGAGPAPVYFYKAWMEHGALTNFSPHAIRVPNADTVADMDPEVQWPSVEHFYQAAKFDVRSSDEAADVRASILAARSPEEAARIGRAFERTRRDLIYDDWVTRKVGVMEAALRAKFTQHEAPRRVLMSTGRRRLVEDSIVDAYWGGGREGVGLNHLGRLLMELREELRVNPTSPRVSVSPRE